MNARDQDVGAPSGIVTFLFTDIEGSTRRWEADADGMRVALEAPLAMIAVLLDRLGRYEPAATIMGFGDVPGSRMMFPEVNSAITHLREVHGDHAYESLARAGATMTTAAIVSYAFDEIDRARAELLADQQT